MGNYKKNIRPINKAKNTFIKWLKDNNCEDLDADKPDVSEEWDYYCVVSGFVGECFYMAYFMVLNGDLSIEYSDDYYKYKFDSVDEFLGLIN